VNTGSKFQSNPSVPKPPFRDRRGHGGTLKTGLAQAVSSIVDVRQDAGIDSENLMVLEMAGAELAPDVDLLQSKLKLSIVEEIQRTDGTIKFVVQFVSKEDIDRFERERALWEEDYPDNSDVLTYAQRRDLFACIEKIRPLAPEDRTGKRLLKAIAEGSLPDGLFLVDIDVWYNGNAASKTETTWTIKKALGTGDSILLGDLFVLPNLLLGRAKVNQFTLEVLRKLDLVAIVDFPIGSLSIEQCELYSTDFVPKMDDTLDDTAPLACVVDSGVFTGNPLQSTLIVADEDFDLTEDTSSDLNGHGTGVAGIVAYGNFHEFDKANRVFKPLVRICNGKVMHNEHTIMGDDTAYTSDKRPEQLVKEAIEYFHRAKDVASLTSHREIVIAFTMAADKWLGHRYWTNFHGNLILLLS